MSKHRKPEIKDLSLALVRLDRARENLDLRSPATIASLRAMATLLGFECEIAYWRVRHGQPERGPAWWRRLVHRLAVKVRRLAVRLLTWSSRSIDTDAIGSFVQD